MTANELSKALEALNADNALKITLSCKKTELSDYKKITLKKADGAFQIEKFTDKQAFHEKISENELSAFLVSQMSENFKQLNASCTGFDFEMKISKKGKILVNKRNNDKSEQQFQISHNRKKNYIFEEGIFVPALYELGVMTAEGKIVASKYDKFKQINRFIECVDDALKNENETSLEIIDFGCGKSYLTFVLYYYMTEIKKRDVHIVGLDLKKDVINKCKDIAKKYNYSGLEFICGDIKDYKPTKAPDMVMTLHACDVATDYALYNAIGWNSKYIFSVPCCQHELNSSLKLASLSVMQDYGLIKERFCALATDAMRCKILEYCGYKVDVLEFIDMDNSPKNILIRANKKKSVNEYKKKVIEKEIAEFSNTLGSELTLKKLLNI